LYAVHDPPGWNYPLALPFAGQMRERVFHQTLMVARALLAHFDDPFCKPFTGCRGLSVTRERAARLSFAVIGAPAACAPHIRLRDDQSSPGRDPRPVALLLFGRPQSATRNADALTAVLPLDRG
jgi:hypothetical protein